MAEGKNSLLPLLGIAVLAGGAILLLTGKSSASSIKNTSGGGAGLTENYTNDSANTVPTDIPQTQAVGDQSNIAIQEHEVARQLIGLVNGQVAESGFDIRTNPALANAVWAAGVKAAGTTVGANSSPEQIAEANRQAGYAAAAIGTQGVIAPKYSANATIATGGGNFIQTDANGNMVFDSSAIINQGTGQQAYNAAKLSGQSDTAAVEAKRVAEVAAIKAADSTDKKK